MLFCFFTWKTLFVCKLCNQDMLTYHVSPPLPDTSKALANNKINFDPLGHIIKHTTFCLFQYHAIKCCNVSQSCPPTEHIPRNFCVCYSCNWSNKKLYLSCKMIMLSWFSFVRFTFSVTTFACK